MIAPFRPIPMIASGQVPVRHGGASWGTVCNAVPGTGSRFGVPFRCSARQADRRAYTLIEMLLVVAVLGIAGALLIPNLVNQDIMNAQAAVRLIIGDLCFAQSDSLAHQELRRVHFYTDGRGYCLVRVATVNAAFDEAGPAPDYIHDPLARAGATGDYIVDFTRDSRFRGVTISSVNVDGAGRDVNYDQLGGTLANGGGPGLGGTIVVTSGTENYEITIAPFTGKLTVRKL